MTDDQQKKALEATRESLDTSAKDIPDEISAALVAARKKAIASAEAGLETSDSESVKSREPNVVPFRRNRMVWSGAMAASVAVLAIGLVLKQPGTDPDMLLPINPEDAMLVLAEMDETEWEMVQELEFALWLSEFGEDVSATDFPG